MTHHKLDHLTFYLHQMSQPSSRGAREGLFVTLQSLQLINNKGMTFFSFTFGLIVGIVSTGIYYRYQMDIEGIINQTGFV